MIWNCVERSETALNGVPGLHIANKRTGAFCRTLSGEVSEKSKRRLREKTNAELMSTANVDDDGNRRENDGFTVQEPQREKSNEQNYIS